MGEDGGCTSLAAEAHYRCSYGRGRCDLPYMPESPLSEQLGSVLKNIYVPEHVVTTIVESMTGDQVRRQLRHRPSEVRVPARSTIHAILDRYGLVARASRTRTRAEGTPLSAGLNPNDLRCTDYKGEFRLGNNRYCYPLTVSSSAS